MCEVVGNDSCQGAAFKVSLREAKNQVATESGKEPRSSRISTCKRSVDKSVFGSQNYQKTNMAGMEEG